MEESFAPAVLKTVRLVDSDINDMMEIPKAQKGAVQD